MQLAKKNTHPFLAVSWAMSLPARTNHPRLEGNQHCPDWAEQFNDLQGYSTKLTDYNEQWTNHEQKISVPASLQM